MSTRSPLRVCVVCRGVRERVELVRLIRRPDGRIGWPSASDHPGKRAAPSGKGLYLCRGETCLRRLLTDKRFKRMFVESMEEECVERLSALLPRQHTSGRGEGKE